LVREAVEIPESARTFGDRRVAGPCGVRPGLAVPGHPCQNNARVAGGQLVPSEIPPLEGSGPERLDDNIGLIDQIEEGGLSGGHPQVQRDAPLVAGVHSPEEMMTVLLCLPPRAQRIRPIGSLDLDHICAHVTEQATSERTGDQRPNLEDPDPV